MPWRRVMVWTTATLLAGGVVVIFLIFLIALYPGFILGKTTPHPNPLPILGGGYSCKGTTSGRGVALHPYCTADDGQQGGTSPQQPISQRYSQWYSCSQRGHGAGPSSTTEPMVCTPAR